MFCFGRCKGTKNKAYINGIAPKEKLRQNCRSLPTFSPLETYFIMPPACRQGTCSSLYRDQVYRESA